MRTSLALLFFFALSSSSLALALEPGLYRARCGKGYTQMYENTATASASDAGKDKELSYSKASNEALSRLIRTGIPAHAALCKSMPPANTDFRLDVIVYPNGQQAPGMLISPENADRACQVFQDKFNCEVLAAVHYVCCYKTPVIVPAPPPGYAGTQTDGISPLEIAPDTTVEEEFVTPQIQGEGEATVDQFDLFLLSLDPEISEAMDTIF